LLVVARMTALRVPFAAHTRWVAALAVIILFIILAQAALNEAGRPRRLGISGAINSQGELIIARVQPAGWAWDAGIRAGDRVVAIDGRPWSPEIAPAALAETQQIETLAPNGQPRVAPAGPPPVPLTPLHQASFLLLALALILIGATVFIVASERAAALALLALSATTALMLTATLGQPSGAEWALILTALGVIGFGGSSVVLFLIFPVRRLDARWARVTLTVTLVTHALLVAGYVTVLAGDGNGYDLFQKVALLLLFADLIGAIALMVTAVACHSRRVELRQNLRLLATGAIVAFAPFAFLSLVPRTLGLDYLVPPDVTILSLVALPSAIGTAIVSRQFLGVTRFVRRGLVALGTWGVLLAVYAVAWTAGARAVPTRTVFSDLLESPVLFVAVIAATFPLAQGWLRTRLERALFRDVYDYRATLHSISEAIVRLSGTQAIASYALDRLGATLDLTWASIDLSSNGGPARYTWPESPGPISGLDPPIADIPLLVEQTPIGHLLVGPKRQDIELLPEDRLLLDTLAPMLATALQSAILLDELQHQIDILSQRESQLAALSNRLMAVQEEERSRLALDLHDDPLQRALLLARQLKEARRDHAPEAWRQEAEDIVQSLKAICAGLRPPTLEDFGLPAGIDWLLDELGARSEITGQLKISTADGEFGRLHPDLELALLRVSQEALNNCVKHSGGDEVVIDLRREPEEIELVIADNGRGYDPADAARPRSEASGLNLGIMGMRERLRPWNGSVIVESSPGRGTVVRARVPLEPTNGRHR
jgi:signal transduction histidine kinase